MLFENQTGEYMPKGKICNPNDNYKRIIDFLRKSKNLPFTLSDIYKNTKISYHVIEKFLLENMRRGFLTRTGSPGARYTKSKGYSYSIIKMPILRESNGAVARDVWKTFLIARHMRVQMKAVDVWNQVNNARKPKISRNAVNAVIRILWKNGTLIKSGLTYILKPGIIHRPTISWQKP